MKQRDMLEDLYVQFGISYLVILLGVFIVYATWKRYKFFVDPSVESWLAPSHALIKRIFGTKGLLIYWYLVGATFTVAGSVGFFIALLKLFKS